MIGADDAPANDNISPNHTPALAAWSYEAIDTKLARETKAGDYAT